MKNQAGITKSVAASNFIGSFAIFINKLHQTFLASLSRQLLTKNNNL